MSIYMKIRDIPGSVHAKGFENWIELISFNFGTRRQMTIQPGRVSDREGTRPVVSEITIAKTMDKSSSLLFSESVIGKAKPEVSIAFVTTSHTITPYVEYQLSNVIVSAYHVSHSQGAVRNTNQSELAVETIMLDFEKIERKYTSFDENNKPGSPLAASYDLRQAVAG